MNTLHLGIVVASASGSFEVPVQYNSVVQAAIYEALTKDVGGFFHNVGFKHGGRSLKLFAFSRLIGKSTLDKGKGVISFQGPTSLVVSSPISQFCSSLATGLLQLGTVRIGSAQLSVTKVQISEPKVKEDFVDVRVLSPVVAYSTMTRPDGRKYTCYFSPDESDFARLTEMNLRRKYAALSQEDAPADPAYRLVAQSTPKLSVVTYKDTIIKGFTCFMRLEGPASLLQVALDSGLGSKNSQGFGCIVPMKTAPVKEIAI